MKSKPMKYAIVEWFDHASFANQSWRAIEDDNNGLLTCISCGWIASEDDTMIKLHLTRTGGGHFSGDITIGKGLIKRIKRFKYV